MHKGDEDASVRTMALQPPRGIAIGDSLTRRVPFISLNSQLNSQIELYYAVDFVPPIICYKTHCHPEMIVTSQENMEDKLDWRPRVWKTE